MVTKHNTFSAVMSNFPKQQSENNTVSLCKHITYIMSFNPYMNSRS